MYISLVISPIFQLWPEKIQCLLVFNNIFAAKTRQWFTNFFLHWCHEDPSYHFPLTNLSSSWVGKELNIFYQAWMCNSLTKYSRLGISQNKHMWKFTILADGDRITHLHTVKALVFPQLVSFLWSKGLELLLFETE